MAIRVNHGVNAGAVAGAAFGGAQGQARQRAAIGGAQAATEEERRRRALLARQQATAPDAPPAASPAPAGQPGAWDPKLGGSAPVGYDPKAAALAALTPEQREARARMDYAAGIRTREAEAAQERRREDLEYSLTTKQRHELEQLASAEADAMASSDFTPAEKEEIRRQIAAKRAGIKPVERPKAPTPAELFKQRTYTDQRTGRVYALDAEGVPGRAIYEPPEKQATFQDRIGAVKAATALAMGEEGFSQDRFDAAMRSMGFTPDGQALGAEWGGVPAPDLGGPEADLWAQEFNGATSRIGETPAELTPEQRDPHLARYRQIEADQRAARGAQGASKPRTLEEKLGADLEAIQAPADHSPIDDPGKVTSLPTVRAQLEIARREAAQDGEDGFADRAMDMVTSSAGLKERGPARAAARRKKAQERVAQLERRQEELEIQEAGVVARLAKLRRGS